MNWPLGALVLALAGDMSPTLIADPGYCELTVPAGWQGVTGRGVIPMLTLTGPVAHGTVARFQVVTVEPSPGVTLDSYVQGSVQAYRRSWQLEAEATASVAGAEARRLELVQITPAGTVRVLKYFVAHQGRLLVLTGTAAPEQFARARSTFEAMVAQLRLRTPAAIAPGATCSLAFGAGSCSYPASWRNFDLAGHEAALVHRYGAAQVLVAVSHVAGLGARADFEAARQAVAPADGEAVVQAGAVELGGRPAYRLVVRVADEEYQERWFAEAAGGRYTLVLRYGDPDLPGEARAAFDALVASWRWR